MSVRRTVVLLMLVPVLGLLTQAAAQGPAKSTPVYTVDGYDPERNPAEDLKSAVTRAKKENKRVLVQVGGEWCGWCHRMTKYFADNEKVAAALARDYLILKVNYSEENRNEEFLKELPKIPGYPHLYVYDSSGKLLHSQGTAELEEGKSYSEEAVLKFLEKWAGEK
jgi:thiol:disulfide interchange protein